jgi:hypothetical protein
MFEFLRFGRNRQKHEEASKAKVPIESASASSMDHEAQQAMIQMALNSVLHRQGILSQWVDCELASMHRVGAADVTLIQLVIRKWHAGLLGYAPDLQNELWNEIRLFDRDAKASDYVIAWRFAPDCGYVSRKLPKPEFWTSSPDAIRQDPSLETRQDDAAPRKPEKGKFDLPESALDDGEHDVDFVATQFLKR